MNRMDVSIVYLEGKTPSVEFRNLPDSKKACSVWIDSDGSSLDLIFMDHKDLAKLIRTLERVYKEGRKEHDD